MKNSWLTAVKAIQCLCGRRGLEASTVSFVEVGVVYAKVELGGVDSGIIMSKP